mgnify:CR=1 FL=1
MFKVVNKTNQTFLLTGFGYLFPYKFLRIADKTEQIISMEKKGLVSVKKC